VVGSSALQWGVQPVCPHNYIPVIKRSSAATLKSEGSQLNTMLCYMLREGVGMRLPCLAGRAVWNGHIAMERASTVTAHFVELFLGDLSSIHTPTHGNSRPL
jgi:hypothetical protein